MKSVEFEEVVELLKSGKIVYGEHLENEKSRITLETEFSDFDYNLSFGELLSMKWFIK